ncbi:SCO0930 family lipoprotein [Streptomyces sp. NBC_00190]|uniref:SCO0930 family lipoprotein n=1 Tax=unclassified Streptomyces TaxID=2593676 RepID=UPI002E2A081A|nr:SCO0930 family lipoprotein [Streptomyces sp. NBC_00190]WSZ45220.1 SCO0930 family lipoprotein [Streptomyces sp. NBC_00868]
MRREIFAGSAVAVLLLTAGCGLAEKPQGQGNSVQPVGDSKKIGSAYGADGSYGADAGSGADSGYGSGSGANPAGEAGKNSPAGQLKVAEVGNVGSAVTDGEGFTLYRFDKDTPKPPKSNCEGDCAKAWPAVAADDATAGAGIEAGLLGSVERADGTRQLTLAGWPVYRYAKDTKAGDTLGEGVGGTWHALGADGKPAAAAKKAPAQAQAQSSELSITKNVMLGDIIADGAGQTLYRFDKDSAWPMKIGCLDACLDTWKPAKPVDKTKVTGIAAELIGSVKRPDGSEQLTIDCWPVYTFTGDKAPGDVLGQGKQGLWFAVTDKGKKAKMAS